MARRRRPADDQPLLPFLWGPAQEDGHESEQAGEPERVGEPQSLRDDGSPSLRDVAGRPAEPDPRERTDSFYSTLGDQIAEQVESVEMGLRGPDPAGESFMERLGRFNMAHLQAGP